MPTHARNTLIALTLSMAAINAAHAQTTWPQPGNHADYGTVEVITLANPSHRNYCRVHTITPDTIVCGVVATRKPVTYQRTDVAAILERDDRAIEHSLIPGLSAAAITVIVVATLYIAPWVSAAIAASAITYAIYSVIHPHTGWHTEEILYQRPNTPLTVHLRTH